MKLSKMYLLAILTGCMSLGYHVAMANGHQNTELSEYVVTGIRNNVAPGGFTDKSADFGILGDMPIKDIPFTVYNLNKKTIEMYDNPQASVNSIIMSVPSVKDGGTITHNDFSIRGHYIQGGSFYVNGIPGLFSQMNAPMNVVSNVEIVSGPNALYGSQMEKNAVAGTINFITKKAMIDEKDTMTIGVSSQKHFINYFDIGKRLGKNKEWGIRLNTELQNGELAVKDSNNNAKSIFINVDHKTKNSKTNIFTGYRVQDVTRGVRWFGIDYKHVTNIPIPPSLSNNLMFDGQIKKEKSTILAINHEQKLNQNTDLFINYGLLNSDLIDNIIPSGSKYTLINNDGDYKFSVVKGRTPFNYRFYQIGVRNNFDTGVMNHKVVLAFSKITQSVYTNSTSKYVLPKDIVGNIYSGAPKVPPFDMSPKNKFLSTTMNVQGVTLNDYISWNKWKLLAGIEYRQVTRRTFMTNGNEKSYLHQHAYSPVYGIMYQPNQNISLYASHSENFSKGEVVDANKYSNGNEILPPNKNKQTELGVKYEKDKLNAYFAYFDNREQAFIPKDINKDKPILTLDGQTSNKGIEFFVTSKVTPKLSLLGGFMRVNSVYDRTAKGLYDGKPVRGSSKWNGVLGLDYKASKNTHWYTRFLYNGSADLGYGALSIPGYTTVQLGVSHSAKINNHDVEMNLSVFNLFNHKYWMTRSGGDEIILGNPRTIYFTTKYSL